MNKSILSLLFILISFVGFAQEKVYWKSVIQHSTKEYKWASQINRMIGPRYVLLKENFNYSIYDSADIDKDGQKEIIVVVSVTIEREQDAVPFNKIIIFKIIDKKLEIIDSSAEYEVDGRGPQIGIHTDSLIITHSVHHGYDRITYIWNNSKNEYLLSRIESSYIHTFGKKGVVFERIYNSIYDINKQILTEKSKEYPQENVKESHSKKKMIHKKLPSNISLKLKDMKDPNEYEDLL